MPTLEIDGIGKVEVESRFLQMTPQQQAAEVDAIAAQIKGSTPAAPPLPAAAPQAPAQDWREAEAQANLAAANPELFQERGVRGNILPLHRDEQGNLSLAVPEGIRAPMTTARDIITGAKTLDQMGGKEAFELGMMFSGLSAAAGTGRGLAAAAEGRAMVGPTRPAAVPPVAPAGQVNVMGARPGAVPAEATKKVLRDDAEAAFKEVDNSGALISVNRVQKLDTDVKAALRKTGYDPDLHPHAAVPLKRIEEATSQGDLAFTDLVKLRRIVGAAESKAAAVKDKSELNVLAKIKDSVDDLAYGLTQMDMRSGSADVSQSLAKANDLWSRSAKLDTIATMIDRATTTAGQTTGARPFEGALVNEFKSLAKNPTRLRTFTPDEQELIKRVARGKGAEKVARGLSKLSPTNIVGGTLTGGSFAGLASLMGAGPVGAAAIGATALTVGKSSQLIARAILQRNIRELETVIAGGGKSRMATDAMRSGKAALKRLAGMSSVD